MYKAWIVSLYAFILCFTPFAYGNDACLEFGKDSGASSWIRLPNLNQLPLTLEFLESLHATDEAKLLRARYRDGESLRFRIPKALRGDASGWGIQGEFLIRVLHALFPAATFTGGRDFSAPSFLVAAHDTTVTSSIKPEEFDMVDLKLANPGPELMPQATLRASMGLPPRARIASFYFSWSDKVEAASAITVLAKAKVFDFAIVSAQVQNDLDGDYLNRLAKAGIPIFDSEEWINLPERPRRALIINQSRGKMPYVHAAADYSVIFGLANYLEPIHAGRPTYFTRRPSNAYFIEAGWNRLAAAATASGLGHSFGSELQLLNLIDRSAKIKESPLKSEAASRAAISRMLEPLIYGLAKTRPAK